MEKEKKVIIKKELDELFEKHDLIGFCWFSNLEDYDPEIGTYGRSSDQNVENIMNITELIAKSYKKNHKDKILRHKPVKKFH